MTTAAIIFGAVFCFSGTAFGISYNFKKDGFDTAAKSDIVIDYSKITTATFNTDNDKNYSFDGTKVKLSMPATDRIGSEYTVPGSFSLLYKDCVLIEGEQRYGDLEISGTIILNSVPDNRAFETELFELGTKRFVVHWGPSDGNGNRVTWRDDNGWFCGIGVNLKVRFLIDGKDVNKHYMFFADDLDVPQNHNGANYTSGPYSESYELVSGFSNDILLEKDSCLGQRDNRITRTDMEIDPRTSWVGDDEYHTDGLQSAFVVSATSPMSFITRIAAAEAGSFLLANFSYSSIVADADEGGTISDSGSINVEWKWDKTYTISPDDNHIIKDVIVDGKSVGAVNSYTFTDVIENHTIHASFEPAITVTFVNPDGTLLKTEKIPVGGNGTAPADPTMSNKTFTGWDKPFTGLTENTTITAQYADIPVKVNYTLRTGDEEGGKLSFDKYDATIGSAITLDGVSSVSLTDGWVLDGYYIDDKKYSEDDLAALTVDKDIDVEVRLFPDKIGNSNTDNPTDPKNTVETPDGVDDRTQAIVTFVDEDETVLNKQVVDLGDDAKAPTDPSQSNKTFTGWDKSFTNIQEDLTVVAQYKTNEPAPASPESSQPRTIQQAPQQSPVQQVTATVSDLIVKTGDNMFAIVLSMLVIGVTGLFVARRMK